MRLAAAAISFAWRASRRARPGKMRPSTPVMKPTPPTHSPTTASAFMPQPNLVPPTMLLAGYMTVTTSTSTALLMSAEMTCAFAIDGTLEGPFRRPRNAWYWAWLWLSIAAIVSTAVRPYGDASGLVESSPRASKKSYTAVHSSPLTVWPSPMLLPTVKAASTEESCVRS